MTKVQTTLLSVTSLIALALTGIALTANAQSQLELSGAADATYDIEVNEAQEANYNNTRSNRSTIASPAETNVCDGVTCADGSCAATADMCDAEEMAADSVCNGYLCDSGECVTSAAMCDVVEAEEMVSDSVCSGYLCDDGQCVSDELWCGVDFDFEIDSAAMAADSVCNGYLCNDGTCVSSEAMCALDFDQLPTMTTRCPADSPIRCGDGSCASETGVCRAIENRMMPDTDSDGRPDFRDEDSDGDGLDDGTMRAQSHNSSRSNRTEGVANDNIDSDDNDLPTDTARGNVDKASPLLFDTLRTRGDEDTKSEEIEAEAGTPRTRPFMKFDDINGEVREDIETGERRLNRISVAARDLRNWTTEDREAFTRLRAEVASNTPEAASLRITEHVLLDDRIEEIEASETEARVEYRTTMRLFGLIPMERNVTARATADGSTTIDYPWYRFLASTPDTDQITALLRDTLDIVVVVPGRAE